MITIIVFGLIFSIYYAVEDIKCVWNSKFEVCILFLLRFLFGAAAGFIVALMMPMKTHYIDNSYEIESISDNNTINGRVFLGSGNINNEFVYAFYVKENDFFELKTASHKVSKIKYTEENPMVVKHSHDPTGNIINWFAIDFLEDKYTFNIPKGSITNNYTLDSQ